MTVTCEINLPEKIIRALGVTEREAGSVMKKELAAYFFQREMLTSGQARQLAELSVWDFLDLLRERKIPLHYGVSEYEEDLKTIQPVCWGRARRSM